MLRRLRSADDGFTLIELLVVLTIMGIVLAGLTQMFAAALKSETDQTRRVDAQQDSRVALDRLRREIHCGSRLTYSSTSSVTVTLPSYCSGPKTTLSSAVTLPSATIGVAGTQGFNSGTNTISFGSSGTVTCTGSTATSFTGCSGGTAGTYSSGSAVTSPVTWCATTSGGPPYRLKRYAAGASVAGADCTGAGGVTATRWLASTAVFPSYTRPTSLVAAPTFAVSGGGRIAPGTYYYDVTAVTANGEFSGTPTSTTITSTTNNTLTLSWSAYTDPSGAAATSYRIYGRDNGSTTAEGLRLLGTVAGGTTSYTDTGPPLTTLSGSLTLPAGTIPVADTSAFTWSPNTISFGSSGTVTCTGKTSTSFLGCSGGTAGTYSSGTTVQQDRTSASPVDSAPPLATLNVSVAVDETPANAVQRATLRDAISLRNSGRF
jgi:prepilin-type N-terminal cleavage/methylation domain-containing protein